MKKRALLISVFNVRKAACNKDYCDALSFALIVKAHHKNSMLIDFSWKKIMSLCHCNLAKAKAIFFNAIDFGLIRVTENGRHIVACRIHNPLKSNEKCVRTWVKETRGKIQISYHKGGVKGEVQTLSKVSNLILSIAIMYGINRYNRTLNTRQTRAINQRKEAFANDILAGKSIGGKRYDVDEYGITIPLPKEKGYCHRLMLDFIFNNNIGLSKLKSLLSNMQKNNEINIKRRYAHFRNILWSDECPTYDMLCPIVDRKTGEREYRPCYRRKIRSKRETAGEYDSYFRRMGNDYSCNINIFVRKKNKYAKKHKYVVNECKYTCDMSELPF